MDTITDKKTKIAVRTLVPPEGLLEALAKARLYYATNETLMHCVWLGNLHIGVFGDPSNGAYEWFVWDADAKSLKHSDVGYGDSAVALWDVMSAEMGGYLA